MELNLFVYVLLIFCIPYLLYSNIRIKPRKGFSILFISIISSVIFLNFSILTILGASLLVCTLVVKNKKIHPYFYGTSFAFLNYEIFEELSLSSFDSAQTLLFVLISHLEPSQFFESSFIILLNRFSHESMIKTNH